MYAFFPSAVFGGGRGGGGGRAGNSARFIYTGSIADAGCTCGRCVNFCLYAVSGTGAIAGTLLTVFGSTNFFQTDQTNRWSLIAGVLLLLIIALIGAMAIGFQFYFRRNEKPPPAETPQENAENSELGPDEIFEDQELITPTKPLDKSVSLDHENNQYITTDTLKITTNRGPCHSVSMEIENRSSSTQELVVDGGECNLKRQRSLIHQL